MPDIEAVLVEGVGGVADGDAVELDTCDAIEPVGEEEGVATGGVLIVEGEVSGELPGGLADPSLVEFGEGGVGVRDEARADEGGVDGAWDGGVDALGWEGVWPRGVDGPESPVAVEGEAEVHGGAYRGSLVGEGSDVGDTEQPEGRCGCDPSWACASVRAAGVRVRSSVGTGEDRR